ncbi:MAG: hypothetical protein LCH63_07785 [Candidatus Melainabacteria bacterium]|jgi:hypothetical protein|nr:hypothetical protein [Candidatus Obscuribacterales bacterium]MCA0313729.1 hypothetical protein [Candidatus Melainabacteria bacterium]OPZ85692.1 MAG: hypothetical protein BWY75_02357 [bacterium ADurb.Bin425]
MLPYILRVLRAMLVSSLGFGGGIGLLVLIVILTSRNEPNAFWYGINVGLSLGAMFAVFMVAVLLPLDLSRHIFLSKGDKKQLWELEQTRELEVTGSAKQVLHACRQALLVVPYVNSVSDDVENLITRATASVSWRSAGEDMEVEITPKAPNQWLVKVVSKPRNKKVVFDYAKNFENVETFVSQFTEILGADHVVSGNA